MRTAYGPRSDDSDFIQPGTLYRQVMSRTDRDHPVENLVWHLSPGVDRFIHTRQCVGKLTANTSPEARSAGGIVDPAGQRPSVQGGLWHAGWGEFGRPCSGLRHPGERVKFFVAQLQ